MKKTIIKYAFLLPVLVIMGIGCSKFDQINTDPNSTTQVTSSMLATTLILNITKNDISSQKSFMQPFMLGKYILWSEDQEDFQYNDLGRGSFSRFALLRNIPPMIGYATDDASKNSYTALGHFVRSWQIFQMTMQLGDIPYSEAIKGETEGNTKPKYDTQKEVFAGILNELDTANMLFAQGSDFDGDPIYGGSVESWQKLTNSFELHVLMNLYKRTDDADLKVIQRFKDIVASRPLMESYDDNFALAYSNKVNQQYPWYNAGSSNPFVIYPMVSTTIINPLKQLKDRRLFYYTQPSSVKIDAGKSPSDWDAYVGVEPSASYSVTTTTHASGDFSDINNRYADLANCEPVSMLSYAELQFILAEAVERGWISGSAETYYEAGIKSAMNFVAAYTPDNADYNHGMPITDAYIQSYLPTVKLAGTFEKQLSQIITQKYISNFLQGVDYNAWFEQRRTGYPEFIINSNSNLNIPADKMPVRWLYPSTELNYNGDNMAEAIQRQFGGNDNVNQVMWILK